MLDGWAGQELRWKLKASVSSLTRYVTQQPYSHGWGPGSRTYEFRKWSRLNLRPSSGSSPISTEITQMQVHLWPPLADEEWCTNLWTTAAPGSNDLRCSTQIVNWTRRVWTGTH